MVTNAQNRCSFIVTRGESRVCNRKCMGEYCGQHNKVLKSKMEYSDCKFCGKRNRSKHGCCYTCYHAKNVRYHTMKGHSI